MKNYFPLWIALFLVQPLVLAQSRPAPSPVRTQPSKILFRDSLVKQLGTSRISSVSQKRTYKIDGVSVEVTELVENVNLKADLVARPDGWVTEKNDGLVMEDGWVIKKKKGSPIGTTCYQVKVRNRSTVATTSSAYLAVLVTGISPSNYSGSAAEREKFREVMRSQGQTIPSGFAGGATKEYRFFCTHDLGDSYSFPTHLDLRYEVYLVTEPIVEK